MKLARVLGQAIISVAIVFGSQPAEAKSFKYWDLQTHSFVELGRGATQRPAPRRQRAPAALMRHNFPKPDAKFDRQLVSYNGVEPPGTIIVDAEEKFLYYVLEDGQAIRMGVGVGREGFGWTGVVHVGAKQENPRWFPPREMVARQPELARYRAQGMAGGDRNPLGVRAIYLFSDEGKDTLYRIHGTIEPYSIGQNVSSGCIRMLNENVTELYSLVKIGTKVVVM
jgi:lipoprotein-anchoring transpeptidase ErfK/SrfK